jgi:quercetin dioxygenase-like cupin family protein
MSQVEVTTAPFAVHADEGEALWAFGGLAVIKATAAQTGGQLTIVEITLPAGNEAPLHIHYTEDEGFWVLEGEIDFQVGDDWIQAGPGSFLWGARNIPHRFRVGDRQAKMLFILTPGGFEDFLREVSMPAPERVTPPPMEPTPEQMAQIAAAAKAHGKELLPG